MPLDIALLATTVWLIADSLPTLTVERFCHAIAERAAPFADMEGGGCARSRRRAQLMRTWAQFHPSDRAHCVRLTTAGSVEGTYTALLTCVEVQRDARNIRERYQGSTTGLRSR
jgi:hypothetical protein